MGKERLIFAAWAVTKTYSSIIAHDTTIARYANPNLFLKSAIQLVQSFIVFVSTMK
jgi:hypothetical protein